MFEAAFRPSSERRMPLRPYMLAFVAGAMFNIVADELTFQYNKSRQQKTTAEILDLVGGLQR